MCSQCLTPLSSPHLVQCWLLLVKGQERRAQHSNALWGGAACAYSAVSSGSTHQPESTAPSPGDPDPTDRQSQQLPGTAWTLPPPPHAPACASKLSTRPAGSLARAEKGRSGSDTSSVSSPPSPSGRRRADGWAAAAAAAGVGLMECMWATHRDRQKQQLTTVYLRHATAGADSRLCSANAKLLGAEPARDDPMDGLACPVAPWPAPHHPQGSHRVAVLLRLGLAGCMQADQATQRPSRQVVALN